MHKWFTRIDRSQAKKGFANEEDILKLNPCRKKKPVEFFCHKRRAIRESWNDKRL